MAGFDVSLSPEALQAELVFLEELLRWNKRINLTSICNWNEALEKHLIDSLLLLPSIESGGRLLDMGSGGGLPGIPLAIARPDLQVVSVDSVGKKINFQKHIKRQLKLRNLEPINARLEYLSERISLEQPFDWVVARAFSSFDNILSLSEQWLKEGGQLLAMKGPEGKKEWRQAAGRSCFQLKEVKEYNLPKTGAVRQLFILEKNLQNKK